MRRTERPFVLVNGATVELIAAGASFRPRGIGDHGWPCLGCGQRRPIQEARVVEVRETGEPPMHRHILLCRPCLDGSEVVEGHGPA